MQTYPAVKRSPYAKSRQYSYCEYGDTITRKNQRWSTAAIFLKTGTTFKSAKLDYQQNIPDKFLKKSDHWSRRRCDNEIVTVLSKGELVIHSHFSRRTGTTFGLAQLDHQGNIPDKFENKRPMGHNAHLS